MTVSRHSRRAGRPVRPANRHLPPTGADSGAPPRVSSTSHPTLGPLHAVHVLSGAAGAHVSSLAGGLVARGVEVTVCGPAASEGDYAFTRGGARFVPVDIGRRTAADAPAVGVLRRMFTGAGVVHAHGLRAGLLSAVALGGRRVPLVVTWHGADAPGDGGIMLRWLERRAVRGASVVLGVSSDLVDRARAHGARDVRLAPVAVPRPVARPPRPPADGERRRTGPGPSSARWTGRCCSPSAGWNRARGTTSCWTPPPAGPGPSRGRWS